jgi:hypothetical protein
MSLPSDALVPCLPPCGVLVSEYLLTYIDVAIFSSGNYSRKAASLCAALWRVSRREITQDQRYVHGAVSAERRRPTTPHAISFDVTNHASSSMTSIASSGSLTLS